MKKNNFKFKLSFKLSIIIMIVSFFGVGLLTYLSFSQAKEIFAKNSVELISRNLEKYELTVQDKLDSLKYDTTMLTYNTSVQGFLRAYHNKFKYDEIENKTYGQFKNEVKSLFLLMLRQNSSYFQVRIIDPKSGNELIKLVKSNNNKIRVIEDSKLQNKSEEPYTKDTIKAKGKIYISQITLNKEFGLIEFPVKPTIRVAKLIYLNKKKLGIIVINANLSKLLEFNKLRKNRSIHTYITNQDGYYILNTYEPFKEFGFEFNKEYRIYYDFLELTNFFNSKQKIYKMHEKTSILEARKIYITPQRFIVIAKHTKAALFDKKAKEYFSNLIFYIIIIIFIIAAITAIVVKRFIKPISDLSHIANEIAKTKGNKIIKIDIDSKDEVGDLANSFEIMLTTLVESKKEVESFANKLEIEVDKKTKELKELNRDLQKKVDEKLKEIRKKDQALLQQNKMASMGEMIGAIAHQWRQPLNSLGLNIQMLLDMAEDENCSIEEIEKFVDNNMETIKFMSKTIDDFRNFFRGDRQKSEFDIKEAIESTISLQKEQLTHNNIKLKTNLKSYKILGFKNQFMQVILNIISNAKDAINEKTSIDSTLKGLIEIDMEEDKNFIIIKITDNGIGIKKELKDRILEPYFTTKEVDKGTGMGLYMSKEIISNMGGSIEFSILKNRTQFIVKIPKRENNG